MGKIIKMTLAEALAKPISARQRAALERFKKEGDATIDYSDIPEFTDEELSRFKRVSHGGARPGAGRPPLENKKQFSTLTISLPMANEIRARAKANRLTIDEFLRRHFAA